MGNNFWETIPLSKSEASRKNKTQFELCGLFTNQMNSSGKLKLLQNLIVMKMVEIMQIRENCHSYA